MRGWADGLNFYLATHPQTHPKALTHFEPWMALSFTEGSIGGDIERIDLKALQAFYEGPTPRAAAAPTRAETLASLQWKEPVGSNGMAIAPQNTQGRHALMLINPHTSFYFRSELQVSSDEGLNVYGAATWGQPFIYQGFNSHIGFMHTSSGVDAVDEFAIEPLDVIDPRHPVTGAYAFGSEHRPLTEVKITLRHRTADGAMASRTFSTWRTHRGPIVRKEGGKWIAFAMMYRPVEALSRMYAAQLAPARRANPTPVHETRPGSAPSRATPATASPAQTRSRARRLPATATANGPRNSTVTAIPSGIRENAW